MAISAAAKVGVASLAALVVVGGALGWLSKLSFKKTGYDLIVLFHDVASLKPGAPFFVMGVKVGDVVSVAPQIDHVDVRVHATSDTTHLLKGSRFKIMSEGLMGEMNLEVFPPKHPPVVPGPEDWIHKGEIVIGDDPARYALLLEQATDAFKTFSKELNPAEFQRMFKQTSKNFVETSEQVRSGSVRFNALLGNAQGLLGGAHNVVGNLERLSAAARPDDVRAAATSLRSLAEGLRASQAAYLGDPANVGRYRQALASAAAATASIQRMASQLEPLTSDPTLRKDLRDTISNIKNITGALGTAPKAMSKAMSHAAAVGGGQTPFGFAVSPRVEVLGERDGGRTGIAGNVKLRLNFPWNYYQAGFEQIGEGNLFNLVFGTRGFLEPNTSFQLGLIRSKLGGGVDYALNTQLHATGELYDPFAPEFRLGLDYFPLYGSQYGLIAQWANVIRTDTHRFWLGVQWRPLDPQPEVLGPPSPASLTP